LPDETSLTDKELQAVGLVQKMYHISRAEGDAIWPAYAPHEIPLLIFRPGKRSFLINPAVPPLGLEQVHHRGVELEVYAVDSNSLGLSANLPFSKGVSVAGSRTFLIRHLPTSRPERWFRLLVHELFHYHQQLDWTQVPFPTDCRYPYEDATLAAGARAEEVLLAAMLEDLDGDLLTEQAVEYLALRRSRYQASDSSRRARAIELWEELVEGTARYVEEMYALAARMDTRPQVVSKLRAYFRVFRPRDMQKWKYYRTGITMGLLLDSLGDETWKEACRAGRSPYAHALELYAAEVEALPESEFTRLLKTRETVAEKVELAMEEYLGREQERLVTWEAEGEYRVELVMGSRGAAYYVNRGLTFVLEDCSRLATGIVSFVDHDFGIDIRNRGVAVRNQDDGYLVVFHDDLNEGTFKLDGHAGPLEPGRRSFNRSIGMVFKGWRLVTEGKGAVSLEEGRLRVEVAE